LEKPVIANALLATLATLIALAVWLTGELRFLVPYRLYIAHHYGGAILLWGVITFVNVFAAVYALQRKLFLKDTGRKLSHIDKQVMTGGSPLPLPVKTEELP
jgi:hypothetical protein